jgi:nucleoid DNA-binding protein
MTLTKANIIDAIAESNGFPRNKASETVETLLKIINQPWRRVRMSLSADLENSVSKRKRNGKAGIQRQLRI